jgi:hypothetical protein
MAKTRADHKFGATTLTGGVGGTLLGSWWAPELALRVVHNL